MIRQAVKSGGSISVLGRSFFVADYVDVVFGTPVLQSSLCGLRLEFVPFVQTAFRCQELLEAGVGAAMPEALLNSVVQPWQLFRSKTEREITSEIQIILVGYGNVAV
jgi:hypothetical protein